VGSSRAGIVTCEYSSTKTLNTVLVDQNLTGLLLGGGDWIKKKTMSDDSSTWNHKHSHQANCEQWYGDAC
jgi:hypothetical protein